MTKELWNQQIFADEAEPAEEQAAAEEQAEKTFTQDEVNKLIADRLSRESAKLKKEAQAAADASLEAAKKEAEKKAKMDAAEKEKYEREQMQKQIDELNAYRSRAELEKTVNSLMAKHNIVAQDAHYDLLIGADEEATEARVETFVKAVEAEVEKRERERAKGTTPKAGGSAKPKEQSEIEKRVAKYKRG